jgi:transposase
MGPASPAGRGTSSSFWPTRSTSSSNIALGYTFRQSAALKRFIDDGRLPIDTNASERALRIISTGRKNWLFFGSDDHAQAAANLLSLIASCQLNGLDPELYLAEFIHVMPYWPRERYLELAPAYWTWTRGRLVQSELEREIGVVTVPELAPLPDAPQQSVAN